MLIQYLLISCYIIFADYPLAVLVLVVALETVEKSSGSLVGNSIAAIKSSTAPEVYWM